MSSEQAGVGVGGRVAVSRPSPSYTPITVNSYNAALPRYTHIDWRLAGLQWIPPETEICLQFKYPGGVGGMGVAVRQW